jgi:hypothetical protein
MNAIHTTTRRRRRAKVMRRTRSVGATGTAKAVGMLKASERQDREAAERQGRRRPAQEARFSCRRQMQGCMFQAAWTPPANAAGVGATGMLPANPGTDASYPGKDASCRRPVQGRTYRIALRVSALPHSLVPHTGFHQGSCEYFTFFL